MTTPKKLDNFAEKPTQVKYPSRATIRSFVQGTLGALTIVPLAIVIFISEVEKAGLVLPDRFKVFLILISTLCGVATSIYARIMAIPRVEQALASTKGLNKLAAVPPVEEPK